MIHFIVSDEPSDKTDEELITLLKLSGAYAALEKVKDHTQGKTIKRIIVGADFINIVTK